MKFLIFIFIILFNFNSAQKKIRIDSLIIKEASEIHLDDYGQLYIYNKNDQSLKKYDSLGKQLSQTMLPRPYKIQSVSNPLNLILFSTNTQEIKLLDHNLIDIQTIDLSRQFGFVSAAYVEDLQTAWIIDSSDKSINQYQYRSNKIINKTPFYINTNDVIDFLVYNNQVFLLKTDSLIIYNLQGLELNKIAVKSPLRLKRNNDNISIICYTEHINYKHPNTLTIKAINSTDKIVDKNQSGLLVKSKNKLYLYES